jgi:glycosyl transferase family 1
VPVSLPPVLSDADPRIVAPAEPTDGIRVASTMRAPGVPAWRDVTVLDSDGRGAGLAWDVVKAGRRSEALIVNGSGRLRSPQFVAASASARLPGGPAAIVVAEASWEHGVSGLRRFGSLVSRAGDAAARAAIRALDSPRMTYCVLSREELELVPRLWGLDPGRVRCTPYHFALWGLDPGEPRRETEPFLFSGGTPLRDYGTLIEAAAELPVPLRIATAADLGPLPPNVTAGLLPHDEYLRQMRDAACVVVPLAPTETRSAGHQTYLNAMALGRPLVVTDAMGVRDYVEDGRTGLVVPPRDPAAMRAALERVIDGAGQPWLDDMTEAAYATAQEHFAPATYWSRLRSLAGERTLASTGA